MLAGGTIPPFADILYDIDSLFKVNRIGNGLDIVNDLNFKAATAQEAIAKIEKLSKLVTGGHVSIRDIFMASAFKDNIPDGSKIALVNTIMALLDRDREQVRFMEFKAALRQTFAAPPPHQTHFMAKTPVGTMTLKEYSRERRSCTRSKDRSSSKSRDLRSRQRSPHHAKFRRDNSASPHRSRLTNTRSGSTSISFHINGPNKSFYLIPGAQRSCIGKCTFVEMGGNLKSLDKSKNSFIFGDGPSTLSLGQAKN